MDLHSFSMVFKFRGGLSSVDDLPTSNVNNGDVFYVIKQDRLYVRQSHTWIQLPTPETTEERAMEVFSALDAGKQLEVIVNLVHSTHKDASRSAVVQQLYDLSVEMR